MSNKQNNTGWICPKCGRVYSPNTTECPKCNNLKCNNPYSGYEFINKEDNGSIYINKDKLKPYTTSTTSQFPQSEMICD